MVNGRAEDIIQDELNPNEKLLWAGRPRAGLRLQRSDRFMIPFSLLWCAFLGFPVYLVCRQEGGPPVEAVMLLPFVAISVYILLGRFVVDAMQRQRTFYGVTDARVIIVAALGGRRATSLDYSDLGQVSLAERDDRSGTICFGDRHLTLNIVPAGWPMASRVLPPRLDAIDNARNIYDVIGQARASFESRSDN